jgi:hypothetical protein
MESGSLSFEYDLPRGLKMKAGIRGKIVALDVVTAVLVLVSTVTYTLRQRRTTEETVIREIDILVRDNLAQIARKRRFDCPIPRLAIRCCRASSSPSDRYRSSTTFNECSAVR